MAQTWSSKLLRHLKEADEALTTSLHDMARQTAAVVLRFATGTSDTGERVVPNLRTTREALRTAIWREVLKPYFIGRGDEAFDGAEPQSPYARLLVTGIRGAVSIQAQQQVAIIKRVTRRHPRVRDWLMAPGRPRLSELTGGSTADDVVVAEQGGRLRYDPYHLWVDPNGYRLSDRVWNTSRDVRRRIDQVLDYHIPQGTAAVDIADELVRFLTPRERPRMTRTPYGVEGSYSARRLARTEITAAAGRATVAASLANPFVDGIDWRLSAQHPEMDICDELATLGMSGERLRDPYPKGGVAVYPPHPHCLCVLMSHVVDEPAVVARDLEQAIDERTPEAERLHGAFNPAWLLEALLYGYFVGSVLRDELEEVEDYA